MKHIIRLLISTVVIYFLARYLPGIELTGLGTALLVAFVLSIVNIFLRPVLVILTLPINIVTFGLFTLVINAVLVLLVAALVPGFAVSSSLIALLFSVLLSILSGLLNAIFKTKNK